MKMECGDGVRGWCMKTKCEDGMWGWSERTQCKDGMKVWSEGRVRRVHGVLVSQQKSGHAE